MLSVWCSLMCLSVFCEAFRRARASAPWYVLWPAVERDVEVVSRQDYSWIVFIHVQTCV